MTAHGDDIDGLKIALEMVLGRLLEESREAHMMRERLGDKDGAIRDLEKKLGETERRAEMAEANVAKREAGDRKLGALHTEAMMARNTLENLLPSSVPQHQVAGVRTIIENLGKAITEAEEFCDPIPF